MRSAGQQNQQKIRLNIEVGLSLQTQSWYESVLFIYFWQKSNSLLEQTRKVVTKMTKTVFKKTYNFILKTINQILFFNL